jgi:hypothetical protein
MLHCVAFLLSELRVIEGIEEPESGQAEEQLGKAWPGAA